MDDFDLMTRYVEEGSKEAFAELVRRHVALVYSSALRQMRNPHDAQDVTQAVFISLARDAHKLDRRKILAGWLMTATRYLCSHARRSASRRRSHERRAAELAYTMSKQTDSAWEQIAPDLDDAIAELGPRNRDAVLLRYFQGKSTRETAEALGITEEAAKRRLSRSLEQLRELLGPGGLTVSSVTLGVLLSANSVHAAPAGLAMATTAASMKFAAAATLQKGTVTLMSAIKSKVAIGLLTLTIGGTTTVMIQRTLARAPATAVAAALVANVAEAKDESWRQRFDSVYKLAANESLHRVPPPFIPEREALFNQIDPTGGMVNPGDDSVTQFTWREGQAEWSSWAMGPPTLVKVVRQIVGLPSYKLEMPLKYKLMHVTGDWILRAGASEDQKMEALNKILHDQLKWKFRLVKRSAEHDVLVASGNFALPGDPKDHVLDVYVDSKNQKGMAAGKVGEFLAMLGEATDTEMIDETHPPAHALENGVFWRNCLSTNPTGKDAETLLANITKQTGTHFAHARRVTARWVLTPLEK